MIIYMYISNFKNGLAFLREYVLLSLAAISNSISLIQMSHIRSTPSSTFKLGQDLSKAHMAPTLSDACFCSCLSPTQFFHFPFHLSYSILYTHTLFLHPNLWPPVGIFHQSCRGGTFPPKLPVLLLFLDFPSLFSIYHKKEGAIKLEISRPSEIQSVSFLLLLLIKQLFLPPSNLQVVSQNI